MNYVRNARKGRAVFELVALSAAKLPPSGYRCESFGNEYGGVDEGSKLASLITCSPDNSPKLHPASGRALKAHKTEKERRMARINIMKPEKPLTHEGARASVISSELQLRRSVLACMLWEDQFYEDGVAIGGRVRELMPKVSAEKVAALAIEAREKMKLRHVPLLLVREMARLQTHRHLVAETLARVIQRADELSEFVALYWSEGRQPLSAQVKKGLAAAFPKFDEYALAKYNRANPVKLRDVLFLSHAKPMDEAQAAVWKRLIADELTVPDTWEVALSSGANKRMSWERLLEENKLGALALLRNIRNMLEVGVSGVTIADALARMKTERVLPFRFVAAANHNPALESEIESAMLKCLSAQPRLAGKTILVVDVSGSMTGRLGRRSELSRMDAAAALAILAREMCEEVAIYCTAGDDLARVHATRLVPSRRGFALRDCIVKDTAKELGGGGIFLVQCLDYIKKREKTADRIIVFTDEQDCDQKLNPASADAFGKHNYLVNVAAYRNGIGYEKFVHIDGFSETVLDYIRESERSAA